MKKQEKISNINCLYLLIVLLLLPFKPILAQEKSLSGATSTDSSAIIIIKPTSTTDQNFSGDGQYQVVNAKLNRPLRVRVVKNDTMPAANTPVYFSLISFPKKAKGYSIEHEIVHTNKDGFAETYVTLGSKPGEYEITARIRSTQTENNLVIFKVFARKTSWVFFLVIGLVGGLGMFLFGMDMMSEGMKKTAGDRMRSLLGTLTRNRFVAAGVGAFVTMVIQSSSATTVMLVSFVQAQLMTFTQSLGIIIGADIGTTITAQLIAFKLTDYALLMVAVGIGLMLLAKKQKIKNIGETTLGFGLLFFGMHVMSDSMYPLRTYEPFISLLVTLENPLFGILVGTIFTALIQSSSAFTGILIVLATQGLLTLEAGIPLLFGANLGTCVTAFLASLNTSREAKRVALAHTLFKIFGVLLFIAWIPYFADLVRWVSPKGSTELTGLNYLAAVVPRQVANAHTIFNVALLVLLPFIHWAAIIITRILPDVEEKKEEYFKTKYLDESLISTPSLALSLAKSELLRMGEIVKTMVEKIIEPFINKDLEILVGIERNEEEVDFLEHKINDYLTKISQQSKHEEGVDEVFQMMYTVTELEQIADIVSKGLIPRAQKWVTQNKEFSDAGKNEILDYHLRTVKQISRALEVFKDPDLEKAARMKRKFKKYKTMEMNLLRTHFERLRKDIPETKATSEYHQELMEQFDRIISHTTNIARVLLEWAVEQKSN